MKVLLSLIVVAVLVLFALAWNAQRLEVAEVRANCEDTGLGREMCICHAREYKGRVPVSTFLGAGEFRPLLMSRLDKNKAVVKAGALCLTEHLLN